MADQIKVPIVSTYDDKGAQKALADARKLDQANPTVTITADTKKAAVDIDGLMKKVDKLDADAATILLTSNATKIAGDITDLIVDLDKLDGNDPQVDVKAAEINSLKADLDQIEAKLKDVNNVPVDIDTKPAQKGLKDVEKSADSSRSVLANMIGNTTQDLGALGGVAGSAGVAIGQMGEYMADAAGEGEGLSSVLRNFGKVAGPLAAIGVTVALITSEINRAQKASDEFDKQVGDLTKSLNEGKSSLNYWIDLVKQTGKLEIGGTDMLPKLAKINVSVEEFNRLASLPPDKLTEWAQAQAKIFEGTSEYDDLRDAVLGMNGAHEAGVRAAEAHQNTEKALADTIAKEDQAASEAAQSTAQLAVNTTRSARAADDASRAWDTLEGSLNIDQAVADVGAAFDDMKTKGQDAWDKTRKGADDAKQAQDDYAQSVRDAKSQVEQLGRQIGLSIPDVKKMLLQIDDGGDIASIQRQLDIMARNRTMQLSIEAKGGVPIPGQKGRYGGVAGRFGMLAGEAGPEFAQFPGGAVSLLTGPTVVPPGTNVTSTADTARILAAIEQRRTDPSITINLPRGTRADDAVAAADRYARRNGGPRARR